MDIEHGVLHSGAGTTAGFSTTFAGIIGQAIARRDTRNLTYFSMALAALMVIEGVYGVMVESLGLVSDAMHMAFHTCGLGITILGMLLSKRPATFAFSYGYERYEVLAAFSNALMLVFVCLFILAGALHRFIEPRAFRESGIPLKLEFGLVGLALNIAGAIALGPGLGSLDHLNKYLHSSGSHVSTSGMGLGIRSAALHAYADAASSLAVLASVAASSSGIMSVAAADTVQSLCTAGFTLYIALPLFNATGLLLLSTRPASLRTALDRARREALSVDGVLEVVEDHAWCQVPGMAIGSVRVRARHDAIEAAITARVGALYSRAGLTECTVQVEKDAPLEWTMNNSGNKVQQEAAVAGPFSSRDAHEEDHGHSHSSHAHSHGHEGNNHSHG